MVSQPKIVNGELVDPDHPIVVDYERKRRELEQLKASKSEMAAAIGQHIDWLLEMEAASQLRTSEAMAAEPFGIAEAAARARAPIVRDPGRIGPSGRFEPGQVSWGDLGRLAEHEPERARDLWAELKQAARHELATGVRGADALESSMPGERTPWRRGRYLAIVDALTADLEPRGALEALLIQRMASTYDRCLHWQHEAIQREEMEVWQGQSTIRQEHARMGEGDRERNRREYGYLPPRLNQAEAIQEAALMSERYERAFLRLVREFRNQRRMFASLIVAEGGTVNIADGGPQQVNMGSSKPTD
jgi:hypothetical protein